MAETLYEMFENIYDLPVTAGLADVVEESLEDQIDFINQIMDTVNLVSTKLVLQDYDSSNMESQIAKANELYRELLEDTDIEPEDLASSEAELKLALLTICQTTLIEIGAFRGNHIDNQDDEIW